jgi:hypothetical protein
VKRSRQEEYDRRRAKARGIAREKFRDCYCKHGADGLFLCSRVDDYSLYVRMPNGETVSKARFHHWRAKGWVSIGAIVKADRGAETVTWHLTEEGRDIIDQLVETAEEA